MNVIPALVSLFDQLVEVALHVLEDEEERLVLADDFPQFDDVAVAQLLQRLEQSRKMSSNLNLSGNVMAVINNNHFLP